MEIETLQFFIRVARTKSISKVANSVHISQSALSQQLQKLETSLGYKLLERSNKGVKLTKHGLIALKYAENIIKTHNAMKQQLREESKYGQSIKIEVCLPLASLPCILYKVKRKFSNYNFELATNTCAEIEENLKNDIADLGLVYGKTNDNDDSLSFHQIGTDKLVLVAAYNYGIEEVSFEDIFKHPFIMLSDRLGIREILVEKAEKLGHKLEGLNLIYSSNSLESVKSSIVKGYGIAFLPYTSIKEELSKEQLKIITIKDFSMRYGMYLISKMNGEYEIELPGELLDYFRTIIKEGFCFPDLEEAR